MEAQDVCLTVPQEKTETKLKVQVIHISSAHTHTHTRSGVTKENHLRWSAIFWFFFIAQMRTESALSRSHSNVFSFLSNAIHQTPRFEAAARRALEIPNCYLSITQRLGTGSRVETLDNGKINMERFSFFFLSSVRSPWQHAQFLSNCNFLRCFLNASLAGDFNLLGSKNLNEEHAGFYYLLRLHSNPFIAIFIL